MSVGLTIRGYARHRGVSHTAVRKALAEGRIVAEDGKIDPEAADTRWASSTDLSKPRNSVIGVPGKRGTRPARSRSGAASDSGAGDRLDRPPGGDTARLVSNYAASRAAREAYLARLAKLDFEERSGKLVDADQVRAQMFSLGRRARQALLGIPDRLAPVLEGQSRAEIHRLLSGEIARALKELSEAGPIVEKRGRR